MGFRKSPPIDETPAQRSKRLTAERNERVAGCPVKETDLTKITRNADKYRTWVSLEWDWETRITWLVFGECSLRTNDRRDGRWELGARFTYGVTDFEHDNIWACKLPLVGVQFEWAESHGFRFFGYVDPTLDVEDRHNGFYVPKPGYDPRKESKVFECKDQRCKGDKPWPHLIVPEGFYVPPFDPELYKLVAGKRVEIIAGKAHDEDG
jgi:hypothetical protein